MSTPKKDKLNVGGAWRAAKKAVIVLLVVAPLWPVMKLGQLCDKAVAKGMAWANK